MPSIRPVVVSPSTSTIAPAVSIRSSNCSTRTERSLVRTTTLVPSIAVAQLRTTASCRFQPLAAGVYYVRVTDSNGSGASAGATTGADAGQTYKLHISADGTAGYAVIGAGSTSVPLTVTVIDDLLVEPTEVVNVRLDSIIVNDPQITFQTQTPPRRHAMRRFRLTTTTRPR